MQLRPPRHAKGDSNRFCGPAVVSALTGMTTGEAARLIRHRTGRKNVMGTYWHELKGALDECGLLMVPIKFTPKLTLAGWLKESVDQRKAGVIFLISAGHHWQLVSGRRYTCGQVNEITSIKDERVARRARVKGVWRIDLRPGAKAPVVPAKARKVSTVDPAKQELRRLEREYGFKGKIEYDGGFKDYVVKPCAVFPDGLSTFHYNWDETLCRVETCLEDPSLIEDGYYSE